MNITQLVLLHNPHKNQAQCLIVITGDVVKGSYCNRLEDRTDVASQKNLQKSQQQQQQQQPNKA